MVLFIDQFGKRITISEDTEGMLLVTFHAVASVILLGWLLGLQYVEVLSPLSVRNAMIDLIKQNMEIYSKKELTQICGNSFSCARGARH